MSDALTRFNHVDRAIAEAETVEELHDIDGMLRTLSEYVRTHDTLGIDYDEVTRKRLNLAWEGGRLMDGLERMSHVDRGRSRCTPYISSPLQQSYRSAGLTYNVAWRWMTLYRAWPTPEAWAERVGRAGVRYSGTFFEAIRRVRRERDGDRVRALAEPTGLHATALIDPPWDPRDSGDSDVAGRSAPHYASMTMAQLEEYPLPDLLLDDAHVYLCVRNRTWCLGQRLLEQWGLQFRTALTWCKIDRRGKPRIGTGDGFRNNTEHILIGVRGSLAFQVADQGTWFAAQRGRHSEKPDELYEVIQRCSPGPYLELFARRERDGWTTHGVS